MVWILIPFRSSLPFKSLANINPTLGTPMYCIPINRNFAAYDAIYWDGASTFYLIQTTVAKEHAIKNEAVKLFNKWSSTISVALQKDITTKFVFVVPKEIVSDWTNCQKLVGVNDAVLLPSNQVAGLKQYVIGMDITDEKKS